VHVGRWRTVHHADAPLVTPPPRCTVHRGTRGGMATQLGGGAPCTTPIVPRWPRRGPRCTAPVAPGCRPAVHGAPPGPGICRTPYSLADGARCTTPTALGWLPPPCPVHRWDQSGIAPHLDGGARCTTPTAPWRPAQTVHGAPPGAGGPERRARWPMAHGAPRRCSPGDPTSAVHGAPREPGRHFYPARRWRTVHHTNRSLVALPRHSAPMETGPYRFPRFAGGTRCTTPVAPGRYPAVHGAPVELGSCGTPCSLAGGARCTTSKAPGRLPPAVHGAPIKPRLFLIPPVRQWRTVHHADGPLAARPNGARCTEGTGTVSLPRSVVAHRAPHRWPTPTVPRWPPRCTVHRGNHDDDETPQLSGGARCTTPIAVRRPAQAVHGAPPEPRTCCGSEFPGGARCTAPIAPW
jgi:hypothetical protein